MLLILVTFLCFTTGIHAGGMDKFFEHSGAAGTQHGKKENASDFYTTNSGIPHLPFLTGFMGTHGTIRFMTISEQTAVIVGDAKHGLWRIQENGMIREYRKKGRVGIKDGVDPNADNLNQDTLDIIKENYASYLPEESWSGYKYPDERISDGSDGMKDYLNFIDLSIYHPKYGGKYDNHVPIDLPNFYCTMSGNDYTHLETVWKYAIKQPLANKLGPLGKRAGMDIKENFPNVLRFSFFEDAGIWANVGVGNEQTDMKVINLQEALIKKQTVNYHSVDFSKVDHEVYIYERPFFNRPYLFITVVMDNKQGKSDLSYVRPHGPYWEGLKKHKDTTKLITAENHFPKIHVENHQDTGKSSHEKIYGLPVYGMHHPNRVAHGLTGGLCPGRGGDWARYPWGNSGSGFPTNYQEITPLCDAIVCDVKIWLNLWTETWADNSLLLGNSGNPGKIIKEYVVEPNIYGQYSDPYLKNSTNPYYMDMTKDGKIVQAKDQKPDTITIKINFTRIGKRIEYNKDALPDKRNIILPNNQQQNCPDEPKDNNDDLIVDYGIAAVVLLIILIIANIIIMAMLLKRQRNLEEDYQTNNKSRGYDNGGMSK